MGVAGSALFRSATLNGALAVASAYNNSKGSNAVGCCARDESLINGKENVSFGIAAGMAICAGRTTSSSGSGPTAINGVTGSATGALGRGPDPELSRSGSTWTGGPDNSTVLTAAAGTGDFTGSSDFVECVWWTTGFVDGTAIGGSIGFTTGPKTVDPCSGSSTTPGFDSVTAGFSASPITCTTSRSAVLRTTCMGANWRGALGRVRSKSTAREGSWAAGEVLRSFANTSPAWSSPTARSKRAPLNQGKRSARSRRSAKSLRETSPGVPNSSVKRSRSMLMRGSALPVPQCAVEYILRQLFADVADQSVLHGTEVLIA